MKLMTMPREIMWPPLALLALVLTGCRVVQETARLPASAMTALVPGGKSHALDPAALQVEVQRFADEYASRTTAALDDYAHHLGTPAARRQALRWKVAAGSAVVSIASGSNPHANLLDFLALTTVTRLALEEVWIKTTNGAAFQPWLDSSRALETNAWKLAESNLTPEQRQEMHDAIRHWWEANPGVHAGFFVRPEGFSSILRQTGERTDRPGSVFGLVGLDPTASLDPAVREVTRTRLFAERAMFMAQRSPLLLRWQIELLADELLNEDQVAAALKSTDRLSRAAESASQTAAQLPDRITAERKAILAELETQEGKLRELSAEFSRTLTAGEKMSTSLNTTLLTFDALMKRFGVGEPTTNAPPATNSPPFNILDYARTAEEMTAMTKALDTTLKDFGSTLDSPAWTKRMEDVNGLARQTKADAKSVLNHAFLLAGGLVSIIFVCALAYRRLGAGAKQTKRGDSE